MSCCTPREKPDSTIPFEQMGCPCDTWAHLKDMFVYLKDERAGVVPCVPTQFTVQWSFIDAMTYMYSVTDVLTGEVIEYSVAKDYVRETALDAFERDWRTRELMYNRGVVCALNDLLEAMEDLNPAIHYKLERKVDEGYIIHKPIERELGVVVFKVEYHVVHLNEPVKDKLEFQLRYPDNKIEFPQELISDIAYGTNVLVRRFRKIGVRFEGIVCERVKDFERFTVIGFSYRDHDTANVIKISYQDMDLNDPTLRTYHEYYTKQGPQNGYYHCK